jgi:hypothetical protein
VKTLLLAAILAATFAAGAVAGQSAWRPFATDTSRGEYGTYAAAFAKVERPKALAVRFTGTAGGRGLVEGVWRLNCQGEVKVREGALLVVNVATAKSCNLSGSAIGGSGTLKVELLRRP